MTSPPRAKPIRRAWSRPSGWRNSWPGTSEQRGTGRQPSAVWRPRPSTLSLKLPALCQSVFLVVALPLSLAAASLQDASINSKLQAPIKTWDEAIPLGNGLLGGLVWGEGNVLRLSLDRGDLWDERPSQRHVALHDRFNWATMQRLVAEDRMAEFNDIFDSNYDLRSGRPVGRAPIPTPCRTPRPFQLGDHATPRRGRPHGGVQRHLRLKLRL